MRLSHLLFALFKFLLPPAVLATLVLYLYPALEGCVFPEARRAESACLIDGSTRPAVAAQLAPFRLLAFGDPQLEGDTSLPKQDASNWRSLQILRSSVRQRDVTGFLRQLRPALQDVLLNDLPQVLRLMRKEVDLWGNDLYLAHIYRSVKWWTQPTHTVVLGDLLGSQWVGDEEFLRRTTRFWNIVFKGAERVPATVMGTSGMTLAMDQDADDWSRRIIAVAGNHDIGYAGDINRERIERFENAFGSVNWDLRLALANATQPDGSRPELHIVVLNSMNLDAPALHRDLRQGTIDFLSSMEHESPALPLTRKSSDTEATILLTHVPLHKEKGVCTDEPYFSYFAPHEGGGIKEQNHLSPSTSQRLLDWLTGPDRDRQALILTGHDHTGCDTYHYRSTPSAIASASSVQTQEESLTREWSAEQMVHAHAYRTDRRMNGVREITVRSMMGSFDGYAGLVSAWWDDDERKWRFAYDVCVAGVQHIWWAVHVLDLVVAGVAIAALGLEIHDALSTRAQKGQSSPVKVKQV